MADPFEILAHSRERGDEVRRLGRVIEADHSDVFGDPSSSFVQRSQDTQRHVVVGDENGGRIGYLGEHLAGFVP